MYIHASIYEHMYTYMYMFIRVGLGRYTYLYTYIWIYLYVYNVYIHTYICICVYIYIMYRCVFAEAELRFNKSCDLQGPVGPLQYGKDDCVWSRVLTSSRVAL